VPARANAAQCGHRADVAAIWRPQLGHGSTGIVVSFYPTCSNDPAAKGQAWGGRMPKELRPELALYAQFLERPGISTVMSDDADIVGSRSQETECAPLHGAHTCTGPFQCLWRDPERTRQLRQLPFAPFRGFQAGSARGAQRRSRRSPSSSFVRAPTRPMPGRRRMAGRGPSLPERTAADHSTDTTGPHQVNGMAHGNAALSTARQTRASPFHSPGAAYPSTMQPERLTRWKYARAHVRLGLHELAAALSAWGISFIRSPDGPSATGALSALLPAVLAAAALGGADLLWHFARARVVQDRSELAACQHENQALRDQLARPNPAQAGSLNLPRNMKPTGYYILKIQKEEREEFERLKVENVELRKRLRL
jgi:hypothetical protein